MYDAIVVGGRCAGAPTAMLLARKGYRVLLVDRATFPSDIMRFHFIWQSGVARLKRWGLLDRLKATNCPPVRTFTMDYGDFPLTGWGPPVDGADAAYGPRRTVLDKILVDAAGEAGAELREGFTVQDLLVEDGRVVGVRGRSRGRAAVTERARIVVGADGMHSVVARLADAPVYHALPALACYYGSYWGGVPIEGLESYWRGRRLILGFPTNDDLTCIVLAWPHRLFHEVRADVEGNFLRTLALVPTFAERVRAGRREEPFKGTADLPNFFRKPYGPGWALVGDAGYHKDPYLAQGMSDAFLGADLLAEAIDAGFAGRRPLEDALADYQHCRDEAVTPLYHMNYRLAALEPSPPEVVQLRAALQGNEEETSRFLGVAAGTVPIQEFYAPENIQRIIASARSR